jgi:hypothetical protein
MSANKPMPLYYRPAPPLCPVCGQSSYSRSGVHPQCSARALDSVRMQRLRQTELRAAAAAGIVAHSR